MIVRRMVILLVLSLILVILSVFIQTPRKWSLVSFASGADNGFPISYLSSHSYITDLGIDIPPKDGSPLYFLNAFNRSTYIDLHFETVPFTFYWARFLIDVTFYYLLVSVFLKIIKKPDFKTKAGYLLSLPSLSSKHYPAIIHIYLTIKMI